MKHTNRNLWVNIWCKPRKTMKDILDEAPNKHLVTLALIHGLAVGIYFVLSLLGSMELNGTTQFVGFSVLMIVGAIILSLFVLFFISCLYQITGKWLNGKGNYIEVKSATGWGFYPQIIAMLFIIAAAIVQLSTHLPIVALILMIIGNILAIWSLVIFFFLLAEAHQFSIWKAILCYILAILVIAVALCIIFLTIKALAPLFVS